MVGSVFSLFLLGPLSVGLLGVSFTQPSLSLILLLAASLTDAKVLAGGAFLSGLQVI